MKCLAKNPTGRYPTAGALADDLERFAVHPRRGVLSLTGWIAGAVVVAAAVVWSVSMYQRDRPGGPTQRTITTPDTPQTNTAVVPPVIFGGMVEGGLVLLGHQGRVAAVVFHPNATWVASGGADRTVRLWDTRKDNPANGHLVLRHPAAVTAVAYKPDGTALAVGCENGQVSVWDVSGPEPKESLVRPGHTGPVTRLVYSPDGMVVFSGGEDGIVWVRDLSVSPPRSAMLPKEKGSILDISVSGQPLRLVVAVGGTECPADLHFWELELTTQKRAVHERGRGPLRNMTGVRAMAVAPDGTTVLAAKDTFVGCWSGGKQPKAIELVGVYQRHVGPVTCLTLSEDGHLVLSGSGDKTVHVWEAKTLKSVRTFSGHDGAVATAAISSNGRQAASGGDDETVRLWRLDD